MADIASYAEAMIESDAAFRDQFDRDSANFHGGITTPVPTGGARVPESMGGAAGENWRDLPEVQMALEPAYPPEYHAAMKSYDGFNNMKKALSTLNKPVEMAMKVRLQYKGSEGDDKTAMLGRLKGEENNRDGSLDAAAALLNLIDPEYVSDRTRKAIEEVVERGKFEFEDKETFGEYMTVLQRCNQAVFADQKKLLQKIKDIKKAAAKANPSPPPPAETATPAEAGA